MLQLIDVGSLSPAAFDDVVGRDTIEQLEALAAPLRGARVLHVNATAYGGGVAEILRSEIPILRGLGIDAEWRVIKGEGPFFDITKAMHNGLQGKPTTLTAAQRDLFLATNERNARELEAEYDFIFMHDPQVAAVRSFAPARGRQWVWRCHIDTSTPDAEPWEFIQPYVAAHDATIFTLPEYLPPGLADTLCVAIAPAIDPISPKNMTLPRGLARRVIEWLGVNADEPLLTQVSRFDPWKDPLGVVEVYRRVRERVPRLQLAMVGSMANDDPEGWRIYEELVRATKDDPRIHVLTNLMGVSNVEVNAFQTLSDVVIQKSIREGFGLIISETLWKGTPIVTTRVGGIPLQIPAEDRALLAESTDDCVERVHWLLDHPTEARAFGARGREWVRAHFLMPRLVADELRLLGGLADGTADRLAVGAGVAAD